MITGEQFKTIVEEAEHLGVPLGRDRAILREYLQSEVLSIFSEIRGSEKFALIGGTGLRLLYGLDRFSEDLDFDTNHDAPLSVVEEIVNILKRRSYSVEMRVKNNNIEHGRRLVFTDILSQLGLSPHKDEALMIKFEYTAPVPMPATIPRVLNRFGFVAQVLTEPLPALCARKAIALARRKRLQPRDIYDLSWFFARRIKPDEGTLRQFGNITTAELANELRTVLVDFESRKSDYEKDVASLLVEPEKAKQIGLVPALIREFF